MGMKKMALIKCLECNQKIYDRIGTVCPKCGFKIDDNNYSKIKLKQQYYDSFKLMFFTYIIYSLVFLFQINIGMNNITEMTFLYYGLLAFFIMNSVNILIIKIFLKINSITISTYKFLLYSGIVLSFVNIVIYYTPSLHDDIESLISLILTTLIFFTFMYRKKFIQ
jgi:ribosomal protein L37E